MERFNKGVLMEQLLLFDKPISELDTLWEFVNNLKHSHEKVRKRMFKEVKELEKEVIKLKAENERIKYHTKIKPMFQWTV